MQSNLASLTECQQRWKAPEIPDNIPHGDMPGDKIRVTEELKKKADIIFPKLLECIKLLLEKENREKVVIAVCGGSGVGKSTIASLLAFYFNHEGIGSYILSGDNYPHRIPKYNDAERLRIYREAGLKGLIRENEYSHKRYEKIRQWQIEGKDADNALTEQYSWFSAYIASGKRALEGYLGTNHEIGFDEVEEIVSLFKKGSNAIWLKRMGRNEEDLWYEQVDFSGHSVLIIEWTHANSDYYHGVDIPILLNSTPEETLEYRRARSRDGATDSPFTMLVLEIEQELLKQQAYKAKIILSKQGEVLSLNQYRALMMKS